MARRQSSSWVSKRTILYHTQTSRRSCAVCSPNHQPPDPSPTTHPPPPQSTLTAPSTQTRRLTHLTRVARAAGEMLHMAEPSLERNLHPTVIVRGYTRALEDALKIVDKMAFPIDTKDRQQMLNVVNSCIGTKFTNRCAALPDAVPGMQVLAQQ